MSSVVISGDTSGAVTLAAPAVAGTTTLTLPTTNANILSSVSPTITSGSILNASGRPILSQSGSVVQTAVTTSGTRTTVDSTSFTEPSTNYRVTLTPVSTSSIIVVHYFIPMNVGTSWQVNTIFSLRAFRSVGGVKTYALSSSGVANGSRNPIAGTTFRTNNGYDQNDPATQHFFVTDSPGTTSAVTYGFEYKRESGGTGLMYFGYTAGDSALWGFDTNITLYVMEIAQ